MKNTSTLFIVISLLTAGLLQSANAETIDLSGEWKFSLDREAVLTPTDKFTGTITLPGTTDTNCIGDTITDFNMTTHLSRKYSYKGKAWYQKEVTIPASWSNDSVYLFIERTKPTEIYVDGQYYGSSNDISTPQQFNLSKPLRPGNHTLTVMVDNSSGVPQQIYGSSHAYCEDTQGNWNGMIGEISLTMTPLSERIKTASTTPVNPLLKDFKVQDKDFYADGHPVFLRGRHDACVWPLTGHVPMDRNSWREYFRICKDYGLNHVRFHSWCPPEAAFAEADIAGIVLQPELPFWGDFDEKDTELMEFLHKEGLNILRTYGHHPSFRLFALGNELWGSIEMMERFVKDFREIAPDKLYTFGSNYYLGYQGVKPGMDFFVTCRVGGEAWGDYNTHTRGSFSFADAADGGIINHCYPNTRVNLEEGCSLSSVPVISHETGQFQSFPDFNEMEKYTGVFSPVNMEIFKARLDSAGLSHLADKFHQASGKWAVELYKQDIEMDLRTPSMAGFQLLDLQDYPGQGSAYIGILDAFLDSKGFVTADEWRGWCSEVVPMLATGKFCYSNNEHLSGDILIANYSQNSLAGKRVKWAFGNQTGEITIPDGEGLLNAGNIDIDLSDINVPQKMEFTLAVEDLDYHNRYNFWVYPAEEADLADKKYDLANNARQDYDSVTIATVFTPELAERIMSGETVLLTPAYTEGVIIGPLFQTDYWNYRMFRTICENNHKPVSPGTLGILTDPSHPVFKDFPTDIHTNWQWYGIIKHSHPLILDNATKKYSPIVRVIDNIERNHDLGLLMEFAMGKGKLLVAMVDLDKADETLEGQQFRKSLLRYATSKDFNPTETITPEELTNLLTRTNKDTELEELNNISKY